MQSSNVQGASEAHMSKESIIYVKQQTAWAHL